MKIRVKWVFMTAAIATILGCNDQEHHHKEGSTHETKSYKLGEYYKPCPGGLYENGVLIPRESKVHAREVFVSEEVRRKYGEGKGVFYYAVSLPDWSDETGRAAVACSSSLKEVAAWVCEKDSSFEGIPCKIEILEGGREEIGGRCVQTEMFVSSYINQCVF